MLLYHNFLRQAINNRFILPFTDCFKQKSNWPISIHEIKYRTSFVPNYSCSILCASDFRNYDWFSWIDSTIHYRNDSHYSTYVSIHNFLCLTKHSNLQFYHWLRMWSLQIWKRQIMVSLRIYHILHQYIIFVHIIGVRLFIWE